MNRLVNFLMVGLAFIVLQVGVAGAAEDCSQFPGTGAAKAECEAANAAADGGTPGMPATTVAPALTIGDPLCVVAPALRDPGCPNAMPGNRATMAPPAGSGVNPMPGAAPMVPPAGGGDGFSFRTHNTQDVGTSATVISAGDAANGGFAFVAGHEVSTTTNRFASIIMYGYGNADVVADLDIRGSVAERTYSVSAGDLRLQFASGTYNVQIIYFFAPNMA